MRRLTLATLVAFALSPVAPAGAGPDVCVHYDLGVWGTGPLTDDVVCANGTGTAPYCAIWDGAPEGLVSVFVCVHPS